MARFIILVPLLGLLETIQRNLCCATTITMKSLQLFFFFFPWNCFTIIIIGKRKELPLFFQVIGSGHSISLATVICSEINMVFKPGQWDLILESLLQLLRKKYSLFAVIANLVLCIVVFAPEGGEPAWEMKRDHLLITSSSHWVQLCQKPGLFSYVLFSYVEPINYFWIKLLRVGFYHLQLEVF